MLIPDKEDNIVKRTVKDSVFCDLFDDPQNQLKLYEFLHPEDNNITLSDFRTVTMNNILTDQLYNDLGFTVKNKLLILVEAQSSWSVNIIPRILMYLAQTLKEYIERKDLNIYGSKKIDMPEPEFYVVYSGTDKKNVKEWYSLAEEFLEGTSTFIDLKVRVLQANEDNQDIVSQYIAFTQILNDEIRKMGRTEEAVRETIRICKDQDILKEYLENKEQEVISIMSLLFSQEEATKAYNKQIAREAKAEGSDERAIRNATRMILKGQLSDEDIADYSGLTLAEVKNLKKSLRS